MKPEQNQKLKARVPLDLVHTLLEEIPEIACVDFRDDLKLMCIIKQTSSDDFYVEVNIAPGTGSGQYDAGIVLVKEIYVLEKKAATTTTYNNYHTCPISSMMDAAAKPAKLRVDDLGVIKTLADKIKKIVLQFKINREIHKC